MITYIIHFGNPSLGPAIQFFVAWNNELSKRIPAAEDYVAAVLPPDYETWRAAKPRSHLYG